jgi:hypothetical protein
VLAQTGRVERRHRLLPARLMVYYVLGLALFSGMGSVEVLGWLVEGLRESAGWRHPREPWRSWQVPAKSALIQARARLGSEPLQVLFNQAARPLASEGTRGAFYRRWRVMSLDGTCLDVADTPANAGVFGRPGSSRGERAGAFPQLRLVGLAECGTHAVVAAALGPDTTSEAALADELLGAPGRLGPELLVLADRGLWGAGRWRRALASGAALVWRVKTGPTGPALPVERVLADGSWLAWLRAGTGDPVLVRVLDYRLDDPGLAPRAGPARALAARPTPPWCIGSSPRSWTPRPLPRSSWPPCTTSAGRSRHPGRAQSPPARPRGGAALQDPDGVCQQVWAHLLVHYALRALMHDTAAAHELDPDRLSFTATLRIVRRHTITRAVFSP